MSLSSYQQKIIIERLEEVKDTRSLSADEVAAIFGSSSPTVLRHQEILAGDRKSPRVTVFYPDLLLDAVNNNAGQLMSPRTIPRNDPALEREKLVTITQEQLDSIVERAVTESVKRMSKVLELNGYGELDLERTEVPEESGE